jgi:hypothetical protein
MLEPFISASASIVAKNCGVTSEVKRLWMVATALAGLAAEAIIVVVASVMTVSSETADTFPSADTIATVTAFGATACPGFAASTLVATLDVDSVLLLLLLLVLEPESELSELSELPESKSELLPSGSELLIVLLLLVGLELSPANAVNGIDKHKTVARAKATIFLFI